MSMLSDIVDLSRCHVQRLRPKSKCRCMMDPNQKLLKTYLELQLYCCGYSWLHSGLQPRALGVKTVTPAQAMTQHRRGQNHGMELWRLSSYFYFLSPALSTSRAPFFSRWWWYSSCSKKKNPIQAGWTTKQVLWQKEGVAAVLASTLEMKELKGQIVRITP